MKPCLFILTALSLMLPVCAKAAEPGPYSGDDVTGIESIIADSDRASERWRQEANERIRTIRMADINLQVRDAGTDRPVSGATVHVRLTRHAFKFGGIVSAKSMTENTGSISAAEYRKIFLEFGFNSAGFNNALKYKQRKSNEEILPKQLAWFKEHHIPVRGHCLIWPGRDHMSTEMTELVQSCKKRPSSQNKEKLRRMCEEQIKTWAAKWDVCEWDVINETRGNTDVTDLLGEKVLADWFKLAREHAVNPDARLYLNENRIISDPANGVKTAFIQKYIDTVNFLLRQDAPLTGLGFQSRFQTMLPAKTIYDRLCLFDTFGLPITATEFEMSDGIKDELDKAVMTERVMTVYFSHPLVDGIYAWTLLPSSEEDEDGTGRNILDGTGLPNLRGKVWLYLMKKRWMTDEVLTTDATGNVSLRGFLGDYEITVECSNRTQTLCIPLTENTNQTIRLE